MSVFCPTNLSIAFGVAFPSSAAAPQSTSIVASVATLTSISTAVVVLPSTVTVVGATSSTAITDFFGAPISTSANANNGPSSPAPTNAFSTSTSTAGQGSASQSSSTGGLSTGAVAGIAVGAVAVVVLALIGGFLIWRRKRNQSRAKPLETAPVDQGELAGGQGGNFGKEMKPTATVTTIKYPPELPDEPAVADPRYAKVVTVPELPQDQRLAPTNPPQPLSPAPAYTEVAAVVPSEIDTATQGTAEYPTPQHGVAEVGSTGPNNPRIAPPISELEHSSFAIYHELPASPDPAISISASTPGLSSQPSQVPIPAAIASSSAAREEDADLKRMKAELEALRVEKARVQELQDMETRERELSRMIVERELRASQGGGGAFGP